MPHFKACCSTWLISVYIKCFEKQKISPQFSSASWWNFSVQVLKNVTLLGRIIFLQWQKQKGQNKMTSKKVENLSCNKVIQNEGHTQHHLNIVLLTILSNNSQLLSGAE